MTESNDKQNDNKNDKIINFMYPSVWLQVLPKHTIHTISQKYLYIGSLTLASKIRKQIQANPSNQ